MTHNVTIVTPWRQRSREVQPYRARATGLDYPPSRLRWCFIEGDSTDETLALLAQWAGEDPRVTLASKPTGSPYYGSVVNADRFRTLATVFNWGLDLVDMDWTDFVLFLPCDIYYHPDLLRRLLAHQLPVVAPFVFQDDRFYDVWAFSRNGKDFRHFRRHDTAQFYGTDPIQLDTIGGVMLIDRAVLRAGCRYSTVNVDRGLCEAARAAGFTVWADPSLHVFHGT